MVGTSLERLMVFTGNAYLRLAQDVTRHLNIPLGRAIVGKFSDGEVLVELLENVRGKDVFVLQSTCAPTNDNLMELLVMVDALKRSSAARVTAAIPYFGYARQDRRPRSARVAISAKVVANMLTSVGVARVLTMDLHADQIQGFFDIPVDNIYAAPLLLGDVWKQRYENLIVVSPDVGGVVRARALAKRLESDLAIIDKRRPRANVSEVMNVIGEVDGRTCVIMDDMVDTAGTLCKAAQVLKQEGATKVVAYCTHAVLSGGAIERIASSDMDELVVTDTIPAQRGGARVLQDPATVGRDAAGGNDFADIHRGVGEFVVHRVGLSTPPVSGRGPGGKCKGATDENRNQRQQARSAGHGCEPPPAPRGQGSRNRLRRRQAAGQYRARSQGSAQSSHRGVNASILALKLDERHGAGVPAAHVGHAPPFQSKVAARRLAADYSKEGRGRREEDPAALH